MKKKINNIKFILLIFAFPLMFAAGCEKKESSSPQPATKERLQVKQVPPVQKQVTSAHISTTFKPSVDFSGRKDPFKPFVVETKATKPVFKRGSKYGPLPIQTYEVSQFRVLGIIAGLKQNSALIVDPAGKSYVVKPGMEIGKNGGQVGKISTTSIEVIEKYRDENGRIKKRTVRLALPKKE